MHAPGCEASNSYMHVVGSETVLISVVSPHWNETVSFLLTPLLHDSPRSKRACNVSFERSQPIHRPRDTKFPDSDRCCAWRKKQISQTNAFIFFVKHLSIRFAKVQW